MLKKVLLGCVLSAFAVAVSAQEMVKPIHRGLVKNSNKTELKIKSLLPKGFDLKAIQGFSATRTMAKTKVPVGVNRSMSKAEAATSVWYAHPIANRFYTISNDDFETAYKNAGYTWPYNTTGSNYYDFFVQIPASYAGASIDSIAYIFLDVENITNAKLWIHNVDANGTVYADAQYCDYSQDIPSSQIKGVDSEGYLQESAFKLNKTFTVGENGCFVGLQFNAPSNAKNILFSGTGETGGAYLFFPYEDSYQVEKMSANGNLPIMTHLDVSSLSTSKAAAQHAYETSFVAGAEGDFDVLVKNEGFSTINSLSYVMTVDQQAQPEKTLTLSEDENASNQVISGNSRSRISFPLPSAVTAGEHFVSVEITKVNGSANESKTTSAGAYVLGIANPAVRTSVVEEATSTACGWCPRGTVGLEKVKEALGDKVITLSVHGQQTEDAIDPMETEDYLVWQANFISSFPTAIINRATNADPYAGFYQNSTSSLYRFGLDKAVQSMDGIMPSEGTISLVATPADMAKVNVTSNVTFNIDREVVPYTLAYVLTQDGLTGKDVENATGNGYDALWSQLNYYATEWINYANTYLKQDYTSKYQDTDMDIYKNGNYVYTEPNGYNNIVVAAWGGTYTTQDGYNYVDAVKGLTFINKDEIEAGTTYTDERTLDLSTKGLIQSHKNLKLAALLINTNNYEIVNAAQVALDFSAGINNVDNKADNNSVVARYNANGVRMSAPMKGLNIVKMADGSVKKFMVK